MKKITCDLCKKDVGLRAGIWQAVTMPEYRMDDMVIGGFRKEYDDLCTECSNKIAEAMNNAVEEIKKQHDQD